MVTVGDLRLPASPDPLTGPLTLSGSSTSGSSRWADPSLDQENVGPARQHLATAPTLPCRPLRATCSPAVPAPYRRARGSREGTL